MRVEQFRAAGLHKQGRTDIAGSALLQVILKQRALDFTFVGLLGLDVVEGEANGTGRGQPGLKQSELHSSRGRNHSEGRCGIHTITVLLPTASCHAPLHVALRKTMPSWRGMPNFSMSSSVASINWNISAKEPC